MKNERKNRENKNAKIEYLRFFHHSTRLNNSSNNKIGLIYNRKGKRERDSMAIARIFRRKKKDKNEEEEGMREREKERT